MKKVYTVFGIALGAMIVTPAFAQEAKPLGLSARIGMFYPSNDKAKKAGKQWLSGGLEYKLGDLKFASGNSKYSAGYSISADIMQKKDYRNVPILLNYVGRLEGGVYYSGGAGVSMVRELTTGGNKKNSTAFGYQVSLGYEFSKSAMPTFIEAKYFGSSKSHLNGFGIFIGARF